MNAAARWFTLLRWAGAVAFAVFLITRLFFLIDSFAVNVPWWDNYNYYFLLSGKWNYWQRFTAQLGPHREGLSMLLSSVIAPLSHWSMRAEAFALGVILSLSLACCLWMKKRAFGKITPMDLLILPAIFLTTRQSDHWVFTINSAHSMLPQFLLMAYCLAWTIPKPRFRDPLVLVITFFAVFTGFGFFVGILTLAAYLLRKNWIAAAITVAIYALYFTNYKFDPAAPHFQFFDWDLLSFPYSLAIGFANITGFWLPPMDQIVGYPMLVAMMAAVLLQLDGFMKRELQPTLSVSLIVFALIYMLFALEGRISFGKDCLMQSRYVPLISTAYIGLYLAILRLPYRWLKYGGLIVAVIIMLRGSVFIDNGNMDQMRRVSAVKLLWVQKYLATGDYHAADKESKIPSYPNPKPGFYFTGLQYLKDHQLGFYYDPREASGTDFNKR